MGNLQSVGVSIVLSFICGCQSSKPSAPKATVIAGAAATSAPAVPPAVDRANDRNATEVKLDRKLPEVVFDAVPLVVALARVGEMTGLQIDVLWDSLRGGGILRETPVSVKFHNIRTSKALRAILDAAAGAKAPLAFWPDGDDRLIVATREDYVASNTEPWEYDARGLWPFFLQKSEEPADGEYESRADELVKLITETINPDSWVATGGKHGLIRVQDGWLLVSQTKDNHRLFQNLMDQLYETKSTAPQHPRRRRFAPSPPPATLPTN